MHFCIIHINLYIYVGARTDPCGTPFDISRGLVKCDSILIE